MKISILLPYKENFTHHSAGAVSLFVSQIVKKSKYKNIISVYGNTSQKNIYYLFMKIFFLIEIYFRVQVKIMLIVF